MTSSRLIGGLFLAGFLSYGVGFALVGSLTEDRYFLTAIPAHQTLFVLGAFMMLLNTVVDVGKGVLFYPILARHGTRTALAYLSALIVEVVLLAVGILALLMLVPLAETSQAMSASTAGSAQALADLALDANTMAYQIAQMVLAIGGLFLTSMLFRTRLVPRLLAGLGVVGYFLHMSGAIAEIFDVHISLILLGSGALFEVSLGVWLLTKGFAAAPYGDPAARVPVPVDRPVAATASAGALP